MKTVYYTHEHAFKSSVIDVGYYDEKNKELYLELMNGTRVGYSSVPLTVWKALTDPKVSAGSFWNSLIKGVYTGINGDVEFRTPEPTVKTTNVYTIDYEICYEGSVDFRAETLEKAIELAKEHLNSRVSNGTSLKIKGASVKF